ncbi:MAG: hypothetical protein GVY19_04490 [Bacteroidetes bacterium]|nr:hypothetical protein [Bacteroidota bacterium]
MNMISVRESLTISSLLTGILVFIEGNKRYYYIHHKNNRLAIIEVSIIIRLLPSAVKLLSLYKKWGA